MKNKEMSEFEPYLAQLDHILNEYLDYEFDAPGKENQSFKEFIEFILQVNEIIDSISDNIWINQLTPLQLEHRSEKLGRLFQVYLTEYKNISARNYDFLQELIAYRIR